VERFNNDLRRKIKIIDYLLSEESAMKIIYPRVGDINEIWSLRALREFYKCIDEIKEMCEKRYPS